MTQSRYPSSGQHHFYHVRRGQLLQQYPVLLPVLFLLGAIIAGVSGLFSNTVFPLLSLFGVSSTLLFLSIACVLGIVSVLIGIISIIESIERRHVLNAMFPKAKEQSYVHRN